MTTKAILLRIGRAALSGWSDQRIKADPAGAMLLSQSAMRGYLGGLRDSDRLPKGIARKVSP